MRIRVKSSCGENPPRRRTVAWNKKVNIGLSHQSKEHDTMTFCLEPRWLRPGFQQCERKIIESQSSVIWAGL